MKFKERIVRVKQVRLGARLILASVSEHLADERRKAIGLVSHAGPGLTRNAETAVTSVLILGTLVLLHLAAPHLCGTLAGGIDCEQHHQWTCARRIPTSMNTEN